MNKSDASGDEIKPGCRLPPQKEHGVMNERVADVSSTIGNLIRIALAVKVEEAEIACDFASLEALHILLLDPRCAPRTPEDDLLNRRLLEAFVRFRNQLELIRSTPTHSLPGTVQA